MQATSSLYKELLAAQHWKETRLSIGETGKLITNQGDPITFGGTGILTANSEADGGYGENILISMETSIKVFSADTPTVGSCVSGEISVEMLRPAGSIPRQARMVPYVRLTDGVRYSEWIQKGVYFIDTREFQEDGSGVDRLILHGYDSMLKAEQDYPASTLDWPATDIQVVQEIADFIDVSVDSRTVALMKHSYPVQYPAQYSCREVLGYIAAMYAGCFVMSDLGELRLVVLNGVPEETQYLVATTGQAITFGGDRILV